MTFCTDISSLSKSSNYNASKKHYAMKYTKKKKKDFELSEVCIMF